MIPLSLVKNQPRATCPASLCGLSHMESNLQPHCITPSFERPNLGALSILKVPEEFEGSQRDILVARSLDWQALVVSERCWKSATIS